MKKKIFSFPFILLPSLPPSKQYNLRKSNLLKYHYSNAELIIQYLIIKLSERSFPASLNSNPMGPFYQVYERDRQRHNVFVLSSHLSKVKSRCIIAIGPKTFIISISFSYRLMCIHSHSLLLAFITRGYLLPLVSSHHPTSAITCCFI